MDKEEEQQHPSSSSAAASITSRWRQRHQLLFHAATRHSFTTTIANGSLPFDSFKRWLIKSSVSAGQDYHFVKAFVRFIASLIQKMPKDPTDEEMDTLLGGMAALRDELLWFRSEATKWAIQLDLVSIKGPALEYGKLLKQLSEADVDYAIGIAALWAIEVVYYESFALCTESNAKTPKELQEACDRWSSTEFKNYCAMLKQLADKCLEHTNSDVRQKAEEIFVQILRQEVQFWDMSLANQEIL